MRHEILTLVGKNCITLADGQKVYELIYPELLADRPVELDFAGVKIFAAHALQLCFWATVKGYSTRESESSFKSV